MLTALGAIPCERASAQETGTPFSRIGPINTDESFYQPGPFPRTEPVPRATLGSIPGRSQADAQRDQLYSELAEEVAQFDRLGNLVRHVSQLVKPSVIHIEAHKVTGKGPSSESYDEAGSGVVLEISGERWVMTNRHVIHGATVDQITMRTSDGRRWSPERILMDASTDVAVMKLAAFSGSSREGGSRPLASPQSLPPAARLADSNRVQIGDFVIAIGSPFGLSHSVTFGIMSAKGRRDLSLGEERIDLQDFFQTDAAINPGNSGGPLLNLRGEVIGLNTAIASSSGGSEGIGFAIPINMAARVAEELIAHGQLRRGYLGVTLDPEFAATEFPTAAGQYASMKVSPDAAIDVYRDNELKFGGARVKNVRAGSPAESARLQKDDIILQFDGYRIEDDDHLVARVGMAPTGQPIEMVILRDGKRYRTEVTLKQMQ
ncbi:S1C family serine protease [Allorhodopirellula heiligendammensis]|uniref:Serine protease HtrA n=1 Tax=Allorhodopirellula heiligendammensis TaxID=2714739 RepID=A0A5C6BX99_9BACT|nr:trypsin-like peptidase domain-containing protein [Allorhodopirellula heiligendammensis]TWU16141.1 putative serine protease HtrA [Allorhodopirellula heiligendammensis]